MGHMPSERRQKAQVVGGVCLLHGVCWRRFLIGSLFKSPVTLADPVYKESFHLLIGACKRSVPALPMLLYTMGVITLLSSSAIYLVESRDNIPSICGSS